MLTGQQAHDAVLALPPLAKRTLFLSATGIPGDEDAAKVEAFVANFAEWCLDEDGGTFLTLVDAWRRFRTAGFPGTRAIVEGKPQ